MGGVAFTKTGRLSMSQLIYVIEDDESIRELIKVSLESFSYRVEAFETAEDGLDAIGGQLPDMALFDLMLPKMDGLSAIKELRKNPKTHDLPIIILTAKGAEIDKVMGLDGGADDYITKPFGVLELTARIRNLFKRTQKHAEEPLSVGDIVLDKYSHEVHKAGKKIELTLKEFDLLALLMENAPNVVKRDELLNRVWGYDFIGETRTLDMHIRTLRQKLSDDADASSYIRTVRGIGYKFVSDGEHSY